MTNIIRPLTLNERKKPAQLTYFGGFKNVSFQIGEIILPDAANRNLNEATPAYSKAIVRKSENIQFPLLIPNSLGTMRGPVNTVASVIGIKNKFGSFDAILVARSTERLSSFNSKLRTVEDLVKSGDETTERLGTSSNARVHNQVMLAGVVVGARFEDSENPKFHIDLRQDSNPNNIIPLVYEARNASAMVTKVKYGSLIYVDGEYAFRSLPVFEVDADGRLVLDAAKKAIPVLDANGVQEKRISTYIRITSPKDPADFDTDFGGTIPKWVSEIAQEITASRSRITASSTRTAAPTPAASAPAVTTSVSTSNAMNGL